MKDYEYKISSDLAVQNKNLKIKLEYKENNILVKNFKEREFKYTNIIFDNLEISENIINLENIIIKELKKYLKKYNLKKDSSVLIVGLGNSDISSDSLGVKTVNKVKATAHLNTLLNTNFRSIYTFIPGVIKDTGIMAFNSIKALKKEIKPDFIIIIDSLVSSSINYLNKLVQITDRGIIPGSGIINYQKEISIKTLKIPVISIGIPIVTYAYTIIRDVLEVKEEKIKYKEGYDLLVASKDVDITVSKLAHVLSNVLNKTLN